MLLSPITAREMQGAQILSGVAMAGFLGARFMGPYAHAIRLALTCLYSATLVGLLFYHLVSG